MLLGAFGMAGYLGYDALRIEAVFESEPAGAVVRIDGNGIGLTPIAASLPPGRHRIELTHSHFLPEVIDLQVDRGDRVRRRVVLRTGHGTLALLSNPRGAWVEVGGERLTGRTPLEVELPSGPATISMGLAERRVAEKDIIVLAGQRMEVNLSLNMDPHGSVTVAVAPADARVRFPELGMEYSPGVRIPIGEQLIEVSRPGYESQTVRFGVRYGDNRTRIELTRSLGTIRVLPMPADADVSLTYEKLPGEDATLAYQPGMQLPAGRVEISARAVGYRTAFQAINLNASGATVRLALERMSVTAGQLLQDALAAGGKGPQMIVIPAGRFVMGAADGPPSLQPARSRILPQPFAVSRYEVSVAEFARFARAGGLQMDERLVRPDEPVRYVSWAESVAYADWLTSETGAKYRLPTEAEWEYVARAGTDTEYWWGDDAGRLCEFANLADLSARKIYRQWAVQECDDGYGRLAPVGSFPANPFGVHDVLGNVSEWVLECGIPPYSGAVEDGSRTNTGQSCSTHGVRGGSWDSQPEVLRPRHRAFAGSGADDRGIRVLRQL